MREVVLNAPLFLVLPENPKKRFYLTLNNYIRWSPHLRTKLRKIYCEEIKKQMISQPVRALTERVQCSCILFPPTDKRVRDTDNSTFVHVKWANDALTEVGLWTDDCIVGPILLDIGTAKKRYPMVLLRYQEV